MKKFTYALIMVIVLISPLLLVPKAQADLTATNLPVAVGRVCSGVIYNVKALGRASEIRVELNFDGPLYAKIYGYRSSIGEPLDGLQFDFTDAGNGFFEGKVNLNAGESIELLSYRYLNLVNGNIHFEIKGDFEQSSGGVLHCSKI